MAIGMWHTLVKSALSPNTMCLLVFVCMRVHALDSCSIRHGYDMPLCTGITPVQTAKWRITRSPR